MWVWYSPQRNEIRLFGVPECKETKRCRWDKCWLAVITKPKTNYFYIGEL